MDVFPSLPTHVPEQVALYQGEHLLTNDVLAFNPQQAAADLLHDREVIAVDLGGDKIRRALYQFRAGEIVRSDEVIHQAKGGAGYLSFLEQVARDAQQRGLAVGISSATRLEGSVITRTVNLPIFFEEFLAAYGADYRRLFGEGVRVANDTVTGICGASTLLVNRDVPLDDVAFFICASGLGASVINQGRAIHVEAAHVPLVDALNPLGQTTRCNVPGKEYVCLERVTAARAGIEDLYRQQTGESLDGNALGAQYEAGEPLPTLLYETSAVALAHAATGVMERFRFEASERSAVVFHGGNFEIPRYRQAVQRALLAIPGVQPRVIFSRDLSANVCLDGAAVLARYESPAANHVNNEAN